MGRSMKSQFKYADKIGAEYVIALGDDEISTSSCKVRKMADGSETVVSFDGLIDFFNK